MARNASGVCAVVAVVLACGGTAQPGHMPEPIDDPSDGTTGSTGQNGAARGESVHFTYGWPSNGAASVQLQSNKARDDGKFDRTVLAKYRLEVKRAEGRTRLVATDFAVVEVKGTLHPTGSEVSSAAGLLPSSIVGPGGRSLEDIDTAGMRGSYLGLQRALVPPGIERDSAAVRLIEMASADESLAGAAQNTWQLLVGNLVERRLPLSEVEVTTTVAKVPFPGEPSIELRTSTSVERSSACAAVRDEGECVSVRYVTEPTSPDELFEYVSKALLSTTKSSIAVEAANITTSTELVLDARTLVPHQVNVHRATRLAIREGNQLSEAGQKENWSLTFDWE